MWRRAVSGVVLAAGLAAGPLGATPFDYDGCVAMAEDDADRALAAAEARLADGADPAAEHCAAVALAAQGALGMAAQRLAALAAGPSALPPETRAAVLAQAGRLWRDVGDAAAAETAAARALAAQPGAVEALALQAELALDRDDAQAAQAALDPAVEAEPDNPWLRLLRAEARRRAGDARAAMIDADAARVALPDEPRALFEAGAARALTGRRDEARDLLLAAVAADREGPVGDRARDAIQAMDAAR